MLLTPRFGPRVRFTSVLTTAPLPPDPVLAKELCTRCMRCARSCPARAIEEGEYPAQLTLKDRCTEHNIGLASRYISPCGICIKVCPVGEDRVRFERPDAGMYSRRDKYPEHHRAWEHVRAYGGRRDGKP
jgi:epoxyqueuosine reductase QueG